MAHWVGTDERPREDGSVVTLSVADVLAMEAPVQALAREDRAVVAQAAMETWGLCGVGVRRGDSWAGVILVAPEGGVPRGHPVSVSGIDCSTAALILVYIESTSSPIVLGKKLCVGLCRRLRGQITGIEAQAGLVSTTLTPSTEWLTLMGFHPLRYPARRYRLHFSSLAAWVQDHLLRYRHPLNLSAQPTPASRTVN